MILNRLIVIYGIIHSQIIYNLQSINDSFHILYLLAFIFNSKWNNFAGQKSQSWNFPLNFLICNRYWIRRKVTLNRKSWDINFILTNIRKLSRTSEVISQLSLNSEKCTIQPEIIQVKFFRGCLHVLGL